MRMGECERKGLYQKVGGCAKQATRLTGICRTGLAAETTALSAGDAWGRPHSKGAGTVGGLRVLRGGRRTRRGAWGGLRGGCRVGGEGYGGDEFLGAQAVFAGDGGFAVLQDGVGEVGYGGGVGTANRRELKRLACVVGAVVSWGLVAVNKILDGRIEAVEGYVPVVP